MNILIVRTSALGDIIQTFNVLDYLRFRFPDANIDWAVEEKFQTVIASHPYVRKTVPIDMNSLKKGWFKAPIWKKLLRSFRQLREEKYDLVFDLQGNCKSGALTFFTRGQVKVGFGIRSAREWPNVLATQVRFEVSKQMDIRLHYLQLVQKYFKDRSFFENRGIRFKISADEKQILSNILSDPKLRTKRRIMVCPGSRWTNKQLPLDTLVKLLQKIGNEFEASFLLVWGSEPEKMFCEGIQAQIPEISLVVDKLRLPAWQNLMAESNLVIAVDSSALHLCGTTSTPSFSIFGPTNPNIFKPSGSRHLAIQGQCPYNRSFEKTCPVLRTCPSGACIKNLSVGEIYQQFQKFLNSL